MTEVFIAIDKEPLEWVSSGENGVIVKRCLFPVPTVKRSTVKLAGADGVLDYSDALGGVNYNDINGIINFLTLAGFEEKVSVFKRFHGKRCLIRHSGMVEGRYYKGLVEYSDDDTREKFHGFTLTCYCEPYQYGETGNQVGFSSNDYSLNNIEFEQFGEVTFTNKYLSNFFENGRVSFEYDAVNDALNINLVNDVTNTTFDDSSTLIEFEIKPKITDEDMHYFAREKSLEETESEYFSIVSSTVNTEDADKELGAVVSVAKIEALNVPEYNCIYINKDSDFRLRCTIKVEYNGIIRDAYGEYHATIPIKGITGVLMSLRYDSGDILNHTPKLYIGGLTNPRLVSGNYVAKLTPGTYYTPLAMFPNEDNYYAVISDNTGIYQFTWQKGYING